MSKKEKENSNIEDEVEINLIDYVQKLDKKHISYILLLLIVLFGFSLRYYHVDYPVIGYHNWKIAHYITEARNFAKEGFFKFGFFVPMRGTLLGINDPVGGQHIDTFPSLQIIIAFFFRIFGESLYVARMVNILFSVAIIPVFYLLVKEMFNREDLALTSALLSIFNPMYVFFSHNIQVINPGLFFMLLGAYFYIKWVKYGLEKNEFGFLYYASFFVMLATVTKYTFAVIGIPILITFPYKSVFKNFNKNIVQLFPVVVLLMGFPMWVVYIKKYMDNLVLTTSSNGNLINSVGFENLVDFKIINDVGFWQVIRSYTADNFTLLGMNLFFIGSLVFLFIYFSNKKNKMRKTFQIGFFAGILLILIITILKLVGSLSYLLPQKIGFLFLMYFVFLGLPFYFIYFMKSRERFGYNFAYAYLFSVVPFVFIMGFKLSGHNYHQFPVAPIIILMIAYLFVFIGKNIEKISGIKMLSVAVILFLVFIFPLPIGRSLYQNSMDSKARMYDTQFPGLDIAGEYIRDHSSQETRFFHSSGQSHGILWHAERFGYKPPADAKTFLRAEDEFNVEWVFAYQYPGASTGFLSFCTFSNLPCNDGQKEVGEYLNDNYRPVQFGFMATNPPTPVYILFRKGGSYNETGLNLLLSGKPVLTRTYERTSGQYNFNYINIE